MSDRKDSFLLAREKLREVVVEGLTSLGVDQNRAKVIIEIFSILIGNDACNHYMPKRTLERFIENANIFCGIQENSGCLPANFFTKLAELYNIVKDKYPLIVSNIVFFLHNSQNSNLKENFIFPRGGEGKQECLGLMMQIMEDNMKKYGRIEHKIIRAIISGLACYNIRVLNKRILEIVIKELEYINNGNETTSIVRRFASFALRVFPNREEISRSIEIRDLNKLYNLFITDMGLPWYSENHSRSYPNQFFIDSLVGLRYSGGEISEIIKEIPAYRQQLTANPGDQRAEQFSPGLSISPTLQASAPKMSFPTYVPSSSSYPTPLQSYNNFIPGSSSDSSSSMPMTSSNLPSYPPTSVLPDIFPSSFTTSSYMPPTSLYPTSFPPSSSSSFTSTGSSSDSSNPVAGVNSNLPPFLSSVPSGVLTSDFTSTLVSPSQNTNSPAPPQNVIQNAAPQQNVVQNGGNQTVINSSRSGSPSNNKDQGHFFN
jgi:hypothetical protein